MPDPQPHKSTDPSRNYRASYRAKMHAEAHSQEGEAAQSAVFTGHPLIPNGKPTLITSDAGMSELIAHVRAAGTFAYDSEFIGELTYIPKLCLIQVATAERVAIVDPLAGVNLSAFWQIVCDPTIAKIVHAGEQDIEPVIRLTGQRPRNVFDTQVVAGFAALAYPVSLQKLVHAMLGYRLGKGLTFTHWDQRPLSAMQLRYAADDVRYLPAVHAELTKKVESAGYMAYAREECERRCDPALFEDDPEQFMKIRGATSMSKPQLTALRELFAWRDSVARAEDVPPRAFVRDDVMAELARTPAKSMQHLAKVRGLPRPVEERFGEEIVSIVTKALANPAADLPDAKTIEESPADRFRIDALFAAVQSLCFGKAIDPAVVTSRNGMADFHRRLTGKSELQAHPLMSGWRHDAVGRPLMSMIEEGKVLTLSYKDGVFGARD